MNTLVQLMKTGEDGNRVSLLNELRRQMGTLPEQQPEFKTEFYRGVTGIDVQIIDGPQNPYKAIYNFATMTWGKRGDKWGGASVEAREAVVRSVLAGESLPLALEVAQWTFVIDKISRWGFDQIARARLGVVFSSMGTRDNNHLDMDFRFHEATWRDAEKLRRAQETALKAKEEYRYFVEQGQGSWQEARELLPISCLHRFGMAANYAALKSICGKRMSFSEAEDVVAVGWLIRERLMSDPQFGVPLMGAYLRPHCDSRRACGYHKAYSMSEAFGCLFKACGRNPVLGGTNEKYEYATHNSVCTDREVVMQQLGIYIPTADEERPETFALTARDLDLLSAP